MVYLNGYNDSYKYEDFIIHASHMSTITSNGFDRIVKRPGLEESSIRALEREINTLRALSESDISESIPRIISVTGAGPDLELTMSVLGTHDLRDVLHDIPSQSMGKLFVAMASDVHSIHTAGFVHRDIKPGNFMVDFSPKKGNISYRGVIDFGMSLRTNKSQNLESMGGTKSYSHPFQLKPEFEGSRTHPGQDWFAFGRTLSHILVGGDEGSFRAAIESGEIEEKISKPLKMVFHDEEIQNLFSELIIASLEISSESMESLSDLHNCGKKIASIIKSGNLESIIGSAPSTVGFQEGASKRPHRHDVLLIVDSTESMGGEISDFRDALNEATSEVSSYPIDLRIDIWSLSDYSREPNSKHDPVRIIGKRLRSEALAMAIGRIESDSKQLDDAEAYEAALQDAYLTNKWSPRKNSTRSIVLVGDSYPHGWLSRRFWAQFFSESKGKGWSKFRSFDSEDHKRKYDLFLDRHPTASERPWEWGRAEEEEAMKEAARKKSDLDEFSGKGHIQVSSNKGKKLRPNVFVALEKCSSDLNAVVHTIFAGGNLVSRNFMKFAAMIGEGSFTSISSGELKITLRGIFMSPDKKLFKEVKEEVSKSDPTTKALDSVTSFVLNT